MEERVEKHRSERPSAWETVEAPRNVAQAIRQDTAIRGEKAGHPSFCWIA